MRKNLEIGADRPLHELPITELQKRAAASEEEIAKLGQWPSWMKTEGSLSGRIPAEDGTAEGFDAGVATALGMIPDGKRRLIAILHGAYTPEAVEQVRREVAELDADAETTWWLAASSLCKEGNVNANDFRKQIEAFVALQHDPQERKRTAAQEFSKMKSSFDTTRFGVPYGTDDGCMQAAYIAGYPFATMYADKMGIYFIGTYQESLGLENFAWSEQKDQNGRPMSGPVRGSKQFVKCANEDEFRRVLDVVKANLGTGPADAITVNAERAKVTESIANITAETQ